MANELCPHCQLPRQGAHSCMDSMRAEIAQLRGNLSLAEEGLANYALEEKQLRADISQAYDLRDKAEGRYCTALGEIERLRKQIEILQHANRFLSEQIPSAHEPREQRFSAEDYERVIAAGGNMWSTLERLREMAMENHGHNSKGAEAFRAFADEHARLMRIRASAPQGASRDASSDDRVSIECPECFGNKRISMSDGSSRRCEYCNGTGRAIQKSK